MIILLTGALGFIGSAYLEEMDLAGHQVIAFDLPEDDILNVTDLVLAMQKCDIVFHMAAVSDLNESMVFQDNNFEINIRGTYNVAKYCRELGKPLIFCSTCCVYGNVTEYPAEEHWTMPQCTEPYATSKVAGEYVIKGMPDLRWLIVRPGTVYGVGQREALFTYIAVDNVLNGNKVYIDGTGHQTRQYIHIDDIVDGFKRATEQFDGNVGEIFNFCGDEPISVLDVIQTAETITGLYAITEKREDRYGQTLNENISTKNAQSQLGWKCKYKFADGMKQAFVNDKRFRKVVKL